MTSYWKHFILLVYLILDVGLRFDTSYFHVTIQEVAKFNVFLKYLVFSENDAHTFLKLKHKNTEQKTIKNYLEKKFGQIDQLSFIIF